MEQIPTAEEFLIQKGVATPLGERWRLNLSRDCHVQSEKDIQNTMIEFAKLHVEAQREAIRKELEQTLIIFDVYLTDDFKFEQTGNSMIDDAYPLNLIK